MWHLLLPVAWAVPTDPFRPLKAEQREHEICSAACLYEQANESLSLIMLTKKKRLDVLENDAFGVQDRFQLIAPFCEGHGFKDADDFKACFKVFKQAEAFWFLKARLALGSNAHAKSILSCDPQSQACPSGIDAVIGPFQETRKAQVPIVVSYEVLQKMIKEGEPSRLDKLAANVQRAGYQGLWQDLEPKKEDFQLYDASSHPLKQGRKPIIDQEAYQRAHLAWVRHGMETAKRAKETRVRLADLQRLSRGSVVKSGLEQRIYEEARNEYLDFLVQSFPGLKRRQGAYAQTEPIEIDKNQRTERSFSAVYKPAQVRVESNPSKAPKARVLPPEKEDDLIHIQF